MPPTASQTFSPRSAIPTGFKSISPGLAFAPVRSSVRSEIFVATRATPFPSPVGAASSVGRGVHAASPHAHQHAQKNFPTPSSIRPLKRPEGRAPSESSVRSEIFAATRARFPHNPHPATPPSPVPTGEGHSPVGAASSAARGVHAASPHAHQHAQESFSAPSSNSHIEAT